MKRVRKWELRMGEKEEVEEGKVGKRGEEKEGREGRKDGTGVSENQRDR